MTDLNWSFAEVWNKSLQQRDERKVVARDHVWASELGKSYVDRWYKMKGHKPSNPPNARSLRKFEAGNVFEWIVEMVLKRAGLLIDKQEWIEYQIPGLPRVTGKLDQLAGGCPDWEKAESGINGDSMPEFMSRVAKDIVKYFKKEHPDGLKPIVLETKSVGSFMFSKYEGGGVAEKHHILQLYHYLLAKDMHEGHIVYISKDDLMLVEFGVMRPSQVELQYKSDLIGLKAILESNDPPKPESEITWDKDVNKFRANWKVAYSPYLTKVYGYKDQAEFDGKWKGKVAQWNRVVGRVISGKNMTALNKSVILDIEKDFPDFEVLVKVKDSNKVEK